MLATHSLDAFLNLTFPIQPLNPVATILVLTKLPNSTFKVSICVASYYCQSYKLIHQYHPLNSYLWLKVAQLADSTPLSQLMSAHSVEFTP